MNKEQLELDIKDIKAKLAVMEEELNKSKAFEFKYENTPSYIVINNGVDVNYHGQYKSNLDNGNYRKYKSNAEEALQLTKETKLIGAIAEQVCEDTEKLKWKDNQYNYTIQLDSRTNKYSISSWQYYKIPGVQYMDECTAIKVCEILNNGEVKL